MAKLPSFGESARSDKINVDIGRVATPSMQYAGAEWEAKGQLVKSVGDFTSALMMKRQESEDANAAAEGLQAYKLKQIQIEEEAKLQYSGDHKGYSKFVSDKYKASKEEISKKLSGGAKTNFEKDVSDHIIKNSADALSYEYKSREMHYLKSKESFADTDSVINMKKPDPVTVANQYRAYMQEQVNPAIGSSYNKDTADKLGEYYRAKARHAIVTGNLNLDTIPIAEDFLKGEDPLTKDLLQGMDEDELNRYNKEIAAKKKSNSFSNFEAELKKLNDAESALMNDSTDPIVKQQAKQTIETINNMQTDDPEVQSRLEDAKIEAKTILQVSDAVAGLKYTPNSAIKDGKAIFKAKNLNEAREMEVAANKYNSIAKRVIEERESDGNAFVQKNFGLLNPVDNIKKQAKLGILNQRAVDKSASAQLKAEYESALSPADKLAILDKISKTYTFEKEDLTPRAINDLINDKSLPAYTFHINNIPDKHVRLSLLRAREMDDKGLFDEQSLARSGATITQISKEVGVQFSPFRKILEEAGDPVRTAAAEKDVAVLAMAKIKDNKISVKDAVKASYNEIFGNNYTIASFGGKSLAIPKKASNNIYIRRDVETVMANPTKALSALGYDKNSFSNFKFEGKEGGDFQFQSAISNARYIPSDDMQSYQMALLDSNGKWKVLKDKDNKVIRIPFNKMDSIITKVKYKPAGTPLQFKPQAGKI